MNTNNKRRAKDRAMIEDPAQWPRWPWLPIKRYNAPSQGDPLECAVMHADANGVPYAGHDTTEVVVFDMSIVEIRHYFPTRDMAAKAKRYSSIDALLDDGWVVD